jgi:MFS family permease
MADDKISGNEIGPFRAVEESTIAHLVTPEQRGDIYAWYSLTGSAGSAFGTMTCGWLLELALAKLDWQRVDVYRLAFCAYGGLGLLKAVLALMLSPAVELRPSSSKPLTGDDEQAPLLRDSAVPAAPAALAKKKPLLPNLGGRGMRTIMTLCFLFALDSFASGLVPL